MKLLNHGIAIAHDQHACTGHKPFVAAHVRVDVLRHWRPFTRATGEEQNGAHEPGMDGHRRRVAEPDGEYRSVARVSASPTNGRPARGISGR